MVMPGGSPPSVCACGAGYPYRQGHGGGRRGCGRDTARDARRRPVAAPHQPVPLWCAAAAPRTALRRAAETAPPRPPPTRRLRAAARARGSRGCGASPRRGVWASAARGGVTQRQGRRTASARTGDPRCALWPRVIYSTPTRVPPQTAAARSALQLGAEKIEQKYVQVAYKSLDSGGRQGHRPSNEPHATHAGTARLPTPRTAHPRPPHHHSRHPTHGPQPPPPPHRHRPDLFTRI